MRSRFVYKSEIAAFIPAIGEWAGKARKERQLVFLPEKEWHWESPRRLASSWLGRSEFPGESMEMMEIDVAASGLLQLLALPRWDSREMLLRTRFGPNRPAADIREMESLIFWY